jgi:anti-sigma factor RsiW
MDAHPDTPHRRAWDAIPWVLAGSANDEDTRCVAEHLPHCADCQAEWAWQTQVRAGLAAGLPEPFPDPEAALRRLSARLDREAGLAEPVDRPREVSSNQASKPGWTRWLVAAVLVQAVALGVSGLAWLRATPAMTLATAPAEFRTLSQTPPPVQRATLRLVPAPGLDFATLQALLTRSGLVIVDVAPDGLHLGLAAADGQTASALAALPRLRAHPGVRLAEATAAATAAP